MCDCYCILCVTVCRISWKKNEVADGEATTFSIFYNNTLFLFLVLCLFYFLNSFNPLMYPLTYVNSLSISLPSSLSLPLSPFPSPPLFLSLSHSSHTHS